MLGESNKESEKKMSDGKVDLSKEIEDLILTLSTRTKRENISSFSYLAFENGAIDDQAAWLYSRMNADQRGLLSTVAKNLLPLMREGEKFKPFHSATQSPSVVMEATPWVTYQFVKDLATWC